MYLKKGSFFTMKMHLNMNIQNTKGKEYVHKPSFVFYMVKIGYSSKVSGERMVYIANIKESHILVTVSNIRDHNFRN